MERRAGGRSRARSVCIAELSKLRSELSFERRKRSRRARSLRSLVRASCRAAVEECSQVVLTSESERGKPRRSNPHSLARRPPHAQPLLLTPPAHGSAMLALRATRALSRTLPTLAQQHRALHASSPAARAIEHLTVVGAGLMGAGIAQVAAASGVKVTMTDVSEGALENGCVSRAFDERGASPATSGDRWGGRGAAGGHRRSWGSTVTRPEGALAARAGAQLARRRRARPPPLAERHSPPTRSRRRQRSTTASSGPDSLTPRSHTKQPQYHHQVAHPHRPQEVARRPGRPARLRRLGLCQPLDDDFRTRSRRVDRPRRRGHRRAPPDQAGAVPPPRRRRAQGGHLCEQHEQPVDHAHRRDVLRGEEDALRRLPRVQPGPADEARASPPFLLLVRALSLSAR